MKNEFETAFKEILELRELPREVVIEALQTALVSAYRKDANAGGGQRVEAQFDALTGRPRLFVEKEVVDSVLNPRTEVLLEKARYYDPSADYGDTVMVQVEGSTKKFGRIAAQTAKQVILQKIREAERNSLFDEFSSREGELVTGTVQSINSNVVTLTLGRAEAILPRKEQIPGERYKPHEKLRVFVAEVKRTNRGPQIVVSRGHRNMLRRLLEYEVPEIYNGQVEIKNIAREAGYRSKVAVAALQEGIDPVGACVGQRGMRIQNIVKELHEEKIDVIEWNPNQEKFIEKALSPARVTGVYLDDDPDQGRTAVVIVPDDQLSLAIGREGQNARLAAKLTGWRIDIKSVTEAVQDALRRMDREPVASILAKRPEVIAEAEKIIEKKVANRTVQPEEYTALGKFADMVEKALLAERQVARHQRISEFNAVRATLPQKAFTLPVTALSLPDEIIEALQPLENVGEIMLRFLIDEERLRRLLKDLPRDTLNRVQEALDKIVMPDDFELLIDQLDEIADEPDIAAQPVASFDSADGELQAAAFNDIEAVDAARDLEVVTPPLPAAPARTEPRFVQPETTEVEFEEEEDFASPDGKKKDKKGRQKKRQLVFDEEIGKTVAKRRRKGSRNRDEWDDYLD